MTWHHVVETAVAFVFQPCFSMALLVFSSVTIPLHARWGWRKDGRAVKIQRAPVGELGCTGFLGVLCDPSFVFAGTCMRKYWQQQ